MVQEGTVGKRARQLHLFQQPTTHLEGAPQHTKDAVVSLLADLIATLWETTMATPQPAARRKADDE